VDYTLLCRLLINSDLCMGLDPVQTLMVEAISLTPVLALEARPFLVLVLMIGASFLLKIADGTAGKLLLFADVMVLLIFSVSKTEDQGLQSWKIMYPLKITLLMVVKIMHLLPSSKTNHSTGQILPLISRMPSFLSSNLIAKITFIRALSMVSGLVHQMETGS